MQFPALVSLFLLMFTACGSEDNEPTPMDPPPVELQRTRIEKVSNGSTTFLRRTWGETSGPVFLRGQRGTLFFGAGEAHIARIDTASCTVEKTWENQEQYLEACEKNGINLLHVEPWNVWEPEAPFPFLRDANGKFRVRDAVESGEWNPEYFQAVRTLIQGASAHGIVVLFSPFNHYNIREERPEHSGRPWVASPFREGNSATGFGLSDYGGDRRLRMTEFFRFSDGQGNLSVIGRIQQAFLERLLEEAGQEGNLAFELVMAPWLMNNPHMTGLDLARWENWIIGVIREKEAEMGRPVPALIVVTPAFKETLDVYVNGQPNEGFEVADWKQAWQEGRAGFENWPEVDVLSYPGFLAFGDPPFPQEATRSMQDRIQVHRQRFSEKVVLLSTDGFNRRYSPRDCRGRLDPYVEDVRHGWWQQRLDGVELSAFPLSWAQRTSGLEEMTGHGGVHFLNWTTAESSMEDLADGSF